MSWVQRTSAGSGGWNCIAMSDDRSVLVAAQNPGYLYVSRDFGATWIPRETGLSRSWWKIVMSSDGSVIYASEGTNGFIWKSTDFGDTWTNALSPTTGYWIALDCNSDGSIVVGASYNGSIYKSTNGATTWSPILESPANWVSIAVSNDGNRIIVLNQSNSINYTTNGGTSWLQASPYATNIWQDVCISSDGMTAYVAGNDIMIKSIDGGANWTIISDGSILPVGAHWFYCSMSSDGNILMAVDEVIDGPQSGTLYMSVNGGTTWNSVPQVGTILKGKPFVTRDGTFYAALDVGAYIWVYGDGNAPLQISSDVSYYPIEAPFTQNVVTLPPVTTDIQGKLITLINKYSKSVSIHDSLNNELTWMSTQNSWATFVAGPSTWLRLGALDEAHQVDFNIQTLNTSTLTTTPVITHIAQFPIFQNPLTSSLTFTTLSGTIQNLQPSSLVFASAPSLPLTVSANTLVYNNKSYTGSLSGEILQFL